MLRIFVERLLEFRDRTIVIRRGLEKIRQPEIGHDVRIIRFGGEGFSVEGSGICQSFVVLPEISDIEVCVSEAEDDVVIIRSKLRCTFEYLHGLSNKFVVLLHRTVTVDRDSYISLRVEIVWIV